MANRAQVAPLIVRPPGTPGTRGTPIVRAPVQVVHTGAPPVHFIHAPNLQLGRGISRDLARQGWEAVQRTALQVVGQPVETFECMICLSNLPLHERIVFRDCRDPKHGCCRDCTRHWIKERVESGQVFSITCARRAVCDCNARASDDEVLRLTDAATYAKYQRFKEIRQDDTIRECPQCGQMCKPTMVQGEIRAEMICPACRCNFCYYHSNAHAGRPCDEYSREISKQLKEMENGALADTKPCPRCGLHTARTGGCNHMTCIENSYRCHWCWVCGQEIIGGSDGVMDHYSATGCNHFPDITETTTPGFVFTCLKVMTFPFRMIFVMLAFLIMLACLLISPLTLLTVCCSTWFCCNKLRFRSHTVIKAILLIPGFLLYVGIALMWMLMVCFCMGIFFFTIMPAEQCLTTWCGCDQVLAPNFDRTHALWLLTVPFNSLDPVRHALICYFARWRCPGRHDNSSSESSETSESD